MAENFRDPQSANEALLQNLLGAENEIREPQSVTEYYLKRILEEGGGGGGTEVVANPTIPSGVTPTSLDKIKIGDSYYSVGEAFIISLINDVIDKTNGEVIDAINANKLILLYDGRNTYSYDSISYLNHYYQIEFTRGVPSSTVLNYTRYRIDANDENLDEHPAHLSSSIPTNNVLANQIVPSGTTPTALDNLKIGAEYFSIAAGGEQHLYCHVVCINITYSTSSESRYAYGVIYNNSASPFNTISSIKEFLIAHGSLGGGWYYYPIIGTSTVGGYYIYYYMIYKGTGDTVYIEGRQDGSAPTSNLTIYSVSDTVSQIF